MGKEITKKSKSKKAVVKKEDNKKFLWAGSQRLMGKPRDQKEAIERELITFTAKAAKISPFGVNILGTLPYLNEMGSEEKAEQYSSGVKFEYIWVQRSLTDIDKAICDCRITDKKGKVLCDWITGECSPASMKMGTLKGYQNHMAQTRAKIRAIKKTFGLKIHLDMMVEIGKMLIEGKVSEVTASKIANATSASAEEVQVGGKEQKYTPVPLIEAPLPTKQPTQKAGNIMAGESEIERIKDLAKSLRLGNIAELEKATGLKIDFKSMTKNQSSRVLSELMQIKISKK